MQRALKALFAASLLCSGFSLVAVPGHASETSFELAQAYNDNTDVDFRRGMQMRLAWTGDYMGRFDGRVGTETLRSIREFQARQGLAADGVMTEAFLNTLIEESDRAVAHAGFDWHEDPETGVRVGLPLALVSSVGRTEIGSMWRSQDETIEIETVRFKEDGYRLQDVFEILSAETAAKTVRTADHLGDHFILTGHEDGRDYYIRFDGEGEDLRGFSVAYAPARAAELAPYIAVASNSFEPYAVPAEDVGGALASLGANDHFSLAFTDPGAFAMRSSRESTAERPDPEFDASGTGFVVSEDGWLLTNAHVANACSTVLVGDLGVASEVIVDESNDLALVRVEGDAGRPLAIVDEKPRLGEDILALGYPLRSILADSLNVTRGNISSLLGLMNDPNYIQISAAVQPGNSGGPVIDLAGRVVGVVTAKLNAVAVADLTGDIPQSINFAIRPDAAAKFLADNDIDYVSAADDFVGQSVPDATADVQASIHPILCLGPQG